MGGGDVLKEEEEDGRCDLLLLIAPASVAPLMAEAKKAVIESGWSDDDDVG